MHNNNYKFSFKYVCSMCGKEFEINPQTFVCDICSKGQHVDEPLKGVLLVKLEKLNTDKNNDSFDVLDFLPVERKYFPSIPVGNTPMWSPKNLQEKFKLKNLYIKDDGLNPSGSLKDRASYLVSAFAKKFNINEITLASTGNAGSSMCAVGAANNQRITLFLPSTAPQGKIVQSLQYGANVIPVNGTYDLAYDLSMEYAKKNSSSLSRSTGYNPLTIEGKKTVSLEIFRDLKFTVPNYVFVSVGDGVIISGVYKGFSDLLNLGLINKMPTVVAVQASGSAAIHRAFSSKKSAFDIVPSNTVADSISVDVPRNGYLALKYLKDFKGISLTVSDEEILCAQHELAKTTGLFSEPAGSTAYAGFTKAVNNKILDFKNDDKVVIISTGNGLKDVASALKGAPKLRTPISKLSEL